MKLDLQKAEILAWLACNPRSTVRDAVRRFWPELKGADQQRALDRVKQWRSRAGRAERGELRAPAPRAPRAEPEEEAGPEVPDAEPVLGEGAAVAEVEPAVEPARRPRRAEVASREAWILAELEKLDRDIAWARVRKHNALGKVPGLLDASARLRNELDQIRMRPPPAPVVVEGAPAPSGPAFTDKQLGAMTDGQLAIALWALSHPVDPEALARELAAATRKVREAEAERRAADARARAAGSVTPPTRRLRPVTDPVVEGDLVERLDDEEAPDPVLDAVSRAVESSVQRHSGIVRHRPG